MAKERWVEARRNELLATPYYHLVFTLPHVLNPLIQGNPRCLYNLLFKAASETLLTFGRDPKWVGGEIGVTFVLHTWGQNLGDHVHLHGLVTGGGLAPDGQHWLKAKHQRFLFPVAALSEVFKAKYLELLIKARRSGVLHFGGKTEELADDPTFAAFIAQLRDAYWTVYAKAPFAGPEKLIDYLGRYTHRAAISNERIVGLDNHQVHFRWRDYRDKSRMKTMPLAADEFIRRFLLHILPSGFMRIRHYGLFANRHRKAKLAKCRAALNQPEPETASQTKRRSIDATAHGPRHPCLPPVRQGPASAGHGPQTIQPTLADRAAMITLAVTDHCGNDETIALRRQPYRSVPDSEMSVLLPPTMSQPFRIGGLKLAVPPRSRSHRQPKTP